MSNRRGPLFGLGLGIGIAVGFLIGSIVVARMGGEATEAVRSVADRVLGRRERVRFEALLQ